VGFISNPLEDRKLYIVNPQYNMITSFRDLNGNGSHIEVFGRKAPKTFRILLVGDSRLVWAVPYPWVTSYNRSIEGYPNQVVIAKRLELELNTLAALEDVPLNFEVMSESFGGSIPLFLWPAYNVPEFVQKNDIDMVLIFQPNTPHEYAYLYYFSNPITPDGIPTVGVDAEYLLKPPLTRIQAGEPRRFYDLCKARHLVKVEGSNFVFDEKLFLDPGLYESLVQMYGKPVGLLRKKLALMKTSTGDPVRLLLCSTHTGVFRQNLEDQKIWVDLAQKFQVPFLDLNEELTALRLSFFPLNEPGNNDHLNPSGHLFFSQLLAHSLIKNDLIPWGRNSSATIPTTHPPKGP